MKKTLFIMYSFMLAFLLSSCFLGGGGSSQSSSHNHVFEQKNTDTDYLAHEATCESEALFYYSCSCGQKGDETFKEGEPISCIYEDGYCIWCGTDSSYQYYDFKLADNGTGYELTQIVIYDDYENFEVPSTYKNLPVTGVSSEFSIPFDYEITNLYLPSTIESIGVGAFSFIDNIKNIIIDENSNLESIEEETFYYCTSLKSINIPNNVLNIENAAFYDCSNLINIIIPSSVTYMGNIVFENCSNLTIYCEVASKLETWSDVWNGTNCEVIWNYEIQ